MEVTPESGFSQDRRKYILTCAKIVAAERFGHKIIRKTKLRNRKEATAPARSAQCRVGTDGSKKGQCEYSDRKFLEPYFIIERSCRLGYCHSRSRPRPFCRQRLWLQLSHHESSPDLWQRCHRRAIPYLPSSPLYLALYI